MAKLSKKFQRWAKNPLFVILLVVLGIAFFTANGNYSFTGAVVGPDVRIVSVTPDLTNKVLTPGQTVEVTVTTKNEGPSPATYKMEHRLVADKNFPTYLALVEPVGNAVAGEDDSVITKLVKDHEPGELFDIVVRAPVPTEASTITGGNVNNWDDTYVQIVGLYQEPGAYMNNEYIVNTNIKISQQYAGQELDQLCETNRDCSGWFLGFNSCIEGMCEEKDLNLTGLGSSDTVLEDFSFKEFYSDYPLLVWGIGLLLVLLVVGVAIPGRK